MGDWRVSVDMTLYRENKGCVLRYCLESMINSAFRDYTQELNACADDYKTLQ
jgi:hypothetical protein